MIFTVIILIANDLGSFAVSWWRGSEAVGTIATASYARYIESGMESAAIYEARQLCVQNGFVFKELKMREKGCDLTVISPVKGTIWMHRIPQLLPYLVITITGGST